MVVVAKPGKIHICSDPKDLNKAIKHPKYQMPTLDETLPKLGKAKVFRTLDGKDGFDKIKLDDDSSKLTTFWMPFGRYQYLKCHLVFVLPQRSSKVPYTNNWEILKAWRYFATICWWLVTVILNRNDNENLLRLLKRAREINKKV